MSKFTAVCSLFIQGKCYRKTCNFAHSAEQLVITECAYSTAYKKCTNPECFFKHFRESEIQYKKRTGCTWNEGKQRIFDAKARTVKVIEPISKVDRMHQKEVERLIPFMDGVQYVQDDTMIVYLPTNGRVVYFCSNQVNSSEEEEVEIIM